jgi:hypothetical protein
MAILPGGRCAMFRRRRNTRLTITPGSAARIREKLASALAQPEKRQDKEDDHDKADDVDDTVHEIAFA